MTATFRDVKADILAKITQGVFAPGALLPNEIELAETYGCARATVNRAMRELSDDGLIERRRKAGTRVRQTPVRQAKFDIPLVRQEIESSGATYSYALIAQEVLEAPTGLRDQLSLPLQARVLHLNCLHFADDVPYQFEDRWINLAELPQAKGVDFKGVGPNEWLVATVPYSDVEISFSAQTADKVLAEHLTCDRGAALFTIERTTWWQGRAITFVRLTFQSAYRMTTKY